MTERILHGDGPRPADRMRPGARPAAASRRRMSSSPGPALRALGGLVVAALAATGCAGTTASATPGCDLRASPRSDKFIVEGDPWSGYAPFRPAGNLLAGNLDYHEVLDQATRACDLTARRADFEVTTIGQYLQNKPDGAIVGVIDQSQGADALVLNTKRHPYLKSIDWLPKLVVEMSPKKPVLAYTGNSPSEELLHELANTFDDFKPAQFDLVAVDQSATALKMLGDDTAQLAIVWEPDTTAARNMGDVVAYSSKDVPNSIIDVIVAGNAVIKDRPADVQKMVSAYYAFVDAKLARPDDLNRFIAEDGALQTEQAKSVIDGIKLYGVKDADAFLNRPLFPLDEPQIHQSVKAIGSLQALSDPALALTDQMVNGSFVAAAARAKP